MRHLPAVGLLLVLGICGCGRSPVTLAGGKPVAYWIEALNNPDVKLRKKAVSKLGNVGPADAAALPALIGALDDRDAGVRCEAIISLLKFGPGARDALAKLEDMQRRDHNAQVRQYAAKAIDKLRSE